MNEHYLHTITHTHLCSVFSRCILFHLFLLFWGQKCAQLCCCYGCVRLFMCNINLKSIRCDNDQIKNSISFNSKRIAIFEWILSFSRCIFGVRFVCITSFFSANFYFHFIFRWHICSAAHTHTHIDCSPVCLLEKCVYEHVTVCGMNIAISLCTILLRKKKKKEEEKSRTIMGICDSCVSNQCSKQVNVAVWMDFTCTPKWKKDRKKSSKKYKWIETSFLFSNVKYQQRKRRKKN